MDFLIPVFIITCMRKISDRLAAPCLNYMENKAKNDNLVVSSKDFVLYTTSNFKATRSVLDGIILDYKCKAKLNQQIPNTLNVFNPVNNSTVNLVKLSMLKPLVLNIGSAS